METVYRSASFGVGFIKSGNAYLSGSTEFQSGGGKGFHLHHY